MSKNYEFRASSACPPECKQAHVSDCPYIIDRMRELRDRIDNPATD